MIRYMTKLVPVALSIAIASSICTTPIAPNMLTTSSISPTTQISVIGDSVAAGWTVTSDIAWPSRLADKLWGINHTKMTVNAIGGRCLVATGCVDVPITQIWNEILTAVPAPTTIILAAGENDTAKVSATVIKTAIAQLVTQAIAANIQVFVATIPPQESSRWPTWWTWGPTMLEVNTWIRTTYGNNVIDFYNAIIDSSTGWMHTRYESGDGVHPNKYGHIDFTDVISIEMID